MNKLLDLASKYLLPAVQAMLSKKTPAAPPNAPEISTPTAPTVPTVSSPPSLPAEEGVPEVMPENAEDPGAETAYFGEIVPLITKYEPVLDEEPTSPLMEVPASPMPGKPLEKNTPSPSSKEVLPPSNTPWHFALPTGKVPYKIVDGTICGSLYQGNQKLSPHFRANEFACPCCKVYKIQIAVLEGLEEVRRRYNGPLSVASTTLESKINPGGSGYRCPVHNAKTAGAAKTSHHMTGKAVDVHPEPFTAANLQRLWQIMQTVPPFTVGALILYRTFVHGDNGGKKKRFRIKS